MIYVVATLTVKPETRAEFIAAATACIKETRKEPGNIAYDLHESVTDPTKMVFVEQWENAEALVPHRTAEHMKTFGRVVVKCIERAAEDRDHHARQRRPCVETRRTREKTMIYVVATTQVKPDQRDSFIAGHKKCIAETLKEKGCIAYEGHTAIHDPNTYVVVERWETRDDLNAHGKAPHMKVWREYSAPLKASPTVIEIISADKVDTIKA